MIAHLRAPLLYDDVRVFFFWLLFPTENEIYDNQKFRRVSKIVLWNYSSLNRAQYFDIKRLGGFVNIKHNFGYLNLRAGFWRSIWIFLTV